MPKILHFADAHIDMANYGRRDADTGLPVRVMDFLRALDQIVDAAIEEQVDLVLFAGDAYKDRNPAPTFQREWGKRIMRLSNAGIPTLLLVGNHDLSPALGRAHALETFNTLEVPSITVIDKPAFLGPEQLGGLPLQVIGVPWISRSGMMAVLDISASDPAEVYAQLSVKISTILNEWLTNADPTLPVILTAHASVQGAKYGGERMVMLGTDLVLPGSMVRDKRLDYVALGHIHKPQDLNEGEHPPVIYPGSIERVDFGEAEEDKFFIIAHVEKGHTEVEWRKLQGIRPFYTRRAVLEDGDHVMEKLYAAMPTPDQMEGAVVRLIVDYPTTLEPHINDAALREHAAQAFEFRLVKRPELETRVRLPEDKLVGSMTPLELLEVYWRASHTEDGDIEALQALAKEVLAGDEE